MKTQNVICIFLFCCTLAGSIERLYACSCEQFNIENVICKSHFAVLALVTGVGPSSKTLDSFYVEVRQSFKMAYEAAKAFRDYGSGLVYSQRKFTSCALRLKSNEQYLIYGHLNFRNQPLITFCTTLKYESLTEEEKMNLNLISVKGFDCKSNQ